MPKGEKILLSNVHFYLSNIKALSRLRPNVEPDFRPPSDSGAIAYAWKGDLQSYKGDIAQLSEDLQALNSAIIMNSFALFEAAYEQLLLSYVNTDNLTGVQEKLVLRHIETVINLSSESRYVEEFRFLSVKSMKEFLTPKEYEAYQVVKTFYVLRHLLAHGSVTKHEMLPGTTSRKVNLDLDDRPFQELVSLLRERLQLSVPKESLNLSLLLQVNSVASFLAIAVHTVIKKMLSKGQSVVKFV
jgi:hypothetical protein